MKRRGKLITATIFAVILIGFLIVAKQVLGGSAAGTIKVTKPLTTKTTVVATTLVAQQGQYASFNYPSYFASVKAEPAVSPVLINYDFLKQQLGSWQLNIQISSLPTNNLRDNGAYNYRFLTPQQFSLTSQLINGQTVPITIDKTSGSFNKIAYLTHPGEVATVSLMGGDGQDSDQMQTAFTALLSSWQWQ